jgi:hypothetical protein
MTTVEADTFEPASKVGGLASLPGVEGVGVAVPVALGWVGEPASVGAEGTTPSVASEQAYAETTSTTDESK